MRAVAGIQTAPDVLPAKSRTGDEPIRAEQSDHRRDPQRRGTDLAVCHDNGRLDDVMLAHFGLHAIGRVLNEELRLRDPGRDDPDARALELRNHRLGQLVVVKRAIASREKRPQLGGFARACAEASSPAAPKTSS
jgi:hypothetical protein